MEARLASNGMDVDSEAFLRSLLFPLVQSLASQESLPALVFSFDRQLCENLAFSLYSKLRGLENASKAGKGSQKELKQLTRAIAAQEKKMRKEPPSATLTAKRTPLVLFPFLCKEITYHKPLSWKEKKRHYQRSRRT